MKTASKTLVLIGYLYFVDCLLYASCVCSRICFISIFTYCSYIKVLEKISYNFLIFLSFLKITLPIIAMMIPTLCHL